MKAVHSALVLAMAVAAAGCSDSESIRILDESKSTAPTRKPVPADQKLYRTLAAMVPADTGGKENAYWWFFKMSGKADAIARHEAEFDKIIATVHSSANPSEPITWDLPPGWTRAEGGDMRYATLKSPELGVEVAVSHAQGTLLENCQRWWGMLWGPDKATEITPVTLNDFVREQIVKGRLILRVDMVGPNEPIAKKPPMIMNPQGGG